jgi:hypothetical protein
MTLTDDWRLFAVPPGAGCAPLIGAPWQAITASLLVVAVLPLAHRYLRYRERMRELTVAEKAIDRSDTNRLPELMSAVYHAPVDQSDVQRPVLPPEP